MAGDITILAVEGVTKDYRVGGGRVLALDDVSLTVAQGEFIALYGPSGSGKTTLLQIAAGLDRPTGGRVTFRGADIAGLREGDLNRLRREQVGFVFQFFNLVPALTATENVALPLRFGGVKTAEARRRALEVLTVVDLGHRAHHLASKLSGGEMQRVALARALAPRPVLLFADEPTGSLDSHNGAVLLQLIGELAQRDGVAVVMASHDPRATGHADRVLGMRDGRLVEDGAGDAFAATAGEEVAAA